MPRVSSGLLGCAVVVGVCSCFLVALHLGCILPRVLPLVTVGSAHPVHLASFRAGSRRGRRGGLGRCPRLAVARGDHIDDGEGASASRRAAGRILDSGTPSPWASRSSRTTAAPRVGPTFAAATTRAYDAAAAAGDTMWPRTTGQHITGWPSVMPWRWPTARRKTAAATTPPRSALQENSGAFSSQAGYLVWINNTLIWYVAQKR